MFILGLHGVLSQPLAEECTYSRFVNTAGGQGRNLPADLYNEMVNRDFKGDSCIFLALIFSIVCVCVCVFGRGH